MSTVQLQIKIGLLLISSLKRSVRNLQLSLISILNRLTAVYMRSWFFFPLPILIIGYFQLLLIYVQSTGEAFTRGSGLVGNKRGWHDFGSLQQLREISAFCCCFIERIKESVAAVHVKKTTTKKTPQQPQNNN